MEYYFFHTEWKDICIIEKDKIFRKNFISEAGNCTIENNKIIIKWDNWEGFDIFMKINDIYYNEFIYKNNIFDFIHNEWSDKCYIDFTEMYIQRLNKLDEKGKFNIKNDIFIINWDKWVGDDVFIKNNNNYYQEIFYNKYINIDNICEIELYYDNDTYDTYILNRESNFIFKKENSSINGIFTLINKKLNIKWNNSIEDIFLKKKNKYFEQKFIENTESKKIYKTEKFKKINNEYYLNNNSKNIINDDLKNNNFIYKIIDYKIINNEINDGLYELMNNKILKNNNYLNHEKILNYINKYEYEDYFENLINLHINFEIPEKKNKRILSLVEWGFPAFGGGEEWLLNLNKIFYNNDFDNYLICFSDPFKNDYFTEIKLINLNYVKIIQMPKEFIKIIQIIRLINPDIINHQGVYRELFMKISNVLEIPFLTGFCFWQNIIKFNQDNININMLENNTLETTEEFNFILKNSYTYVSSNFVNDVIHKLYNIKLDVIESISLKDDFYIENKDYDIKKYVTLINCHYNKGGYLLRYLFENLDINIPILIVYTENDPVINIELLHVLINERNLKNNINLLIVEKINIKIIYKKTRILLVPSLCEETFCRVAYEGMLNNIPILSTKNGNLKYLLKDYAIFIKDLNLETWKNEIQRLYSDINLIKNFKHNNILIEEVIEKKIISKINNIKGSKYKLNEKNIGIIVPWADQGLGIQGREYYITLKELGYKPHILSFRPYHATYENIYLQSNKEEWEYENIVYSENIRENLTYDELFNFVYKYNIKQIIMIEATFVNIFKLAMFLKLLNIKIYIVVNIECIRMVELNYHNIFDKILTNNIESEKIISKIFKNKSQFLGFNLNHPYFQKVNKSIKINLNKIKFCCVGGLNSITRKNIDLIISSFYNIYKDDIEIDIDWELNVYIQGVEVPEIVNNYKCCNINYYINNSTYENIVSIYNSNDIFLHMGSHEGLGLGFFESLYCGTPIITMDWTPNNEIIINNINGWIIECYYGEIYDNDNSLINKGVINETDLKKKVTEILINKENTLKIINNTINNKNILYEKNKNMFNKNIINILSS